MKIEHRRERGNVPFRSSRGVTQTRAPRSPVSPAGMY